MHTERDAVVLQKEDTSQTEGDRKVPNGCEGQTHLTVIATHRFVTCNGKHLKEVSQPKVIVYSLSSPFNAKSEFN